MKIARIFPRKNKATPDDSDAFVIGRYKLPDLIGYDRVEISVTFTWDIPKAEKEAERLAKHGHCVEVGGAAYGDRFSDTFVSGQYIKKGYVFTSRGCPNHCWFCSVPKACHGKVKELPIVDGWIVQDDNILATSNEHFDKVIEMLKRQEHKAVFSGGLDPALLTLDRAKKIKDLKPKGIYFAYDTPNDWDAIVHASDVVKEAGFPQNTHSISCYVLIGYPNDTMEKAERRLIDTVKLGFMPYAMLYRDYESKKKPSVEWRRFQREWCSPIIVGAKFNQIRGEKWKQSTNYRMMSH